jgi:dTDP-4-dehydrorhamnose 3,5-epimerase
LPIQIEATAIPDVKMIRGTRFYDERGFFAETYKESEYLEVGIPKFVQDNMSESSKGVIRGLHWQEKPHAQGKLVSCVHGRILDVAVDLRKNSKYFGQLVAIELNSKEASSLWIPEGFAHGFQALEEETIVNYKVTKFWDKSSERGINPLSLGPKLVWPIKSPILSTKDLEASEIDLILNA